MQNNTIQRIDSLKTLFQVTASNLFIQDLPEELAKKVKTSDPIIWPILMTTYQIIKEVNLGWQDIAKEVGIIIAGNAYPLQSTKKLMEELKQNRRVSPFHFINANAGAPISICSTLFNFQGPTINLAVTDKIRESVAALVAGQWLRNGSAQYIFFIRPDFNNQYNCLVTNTLWTWRSE